MRIFTVIVLFSIAVIPPLKAQSQYWQYGAKGGLNIARLGQDGGENATALLGIHGGLMAERVFSERFGLEIDLLYSEQGAQNRFNSQDQIRLRYINSSLLFKARIFSDWRFFAGPQIGYLLHASRDAQNITDVYKTFDVSLAMGVFYESRDIQVGISYNLGLNNLDNISDDPSKYKETNQVAQISLGYFFLRSGTRQKD